MWDFIEKQILGMRWLFDLIGNVLEMFGLNITTGLGGVLHFFIYDVIKIVNKHREDIYKFY
ncbi:MAG: hypothetical protein RR585_11405, partial [Coprobacillus sp.]